MLVHPLDRRADSHLARRDTHSRVEEIQVWQLAIDTVIGNVERLEAVVKRIVEADCSL